jgi:extracellular elastinolytic metalloproteinase
MKSVCYWLAAIMLAALQPSLAATDLARSALQERSEALGLSAADIADVEITDHYRTRHTGVEHVWLRQRIDGLPVALALTNVNIGRDGQIWSLNSRFVANAAARTAARQPGLSPQQALARYAEERRLEFGESVTLATIRGDESFIFHGGSMADGDIPVHLAWLEHEGHLHLTWEVAVDEKGRPDWFNAWIDAHSGEVLKAVNWTQEAGYRVFAEPLEHPGEGEPSFVEDPADPQASPLGWHNTGNNQYTDTRGNNVFAQEDTAANNTGGRRPDGGPDLIFDFPIDLATQQPPQYEDFAITNLFYWNNLIHDVLWHYGFDEPAGNFQVNNFGLGGQGGDPVRADAQDGSGTNNANFSTPPDGSPPRMQMYIWTPSGGNPAELRIAEPAATAGTYPVATATWGEVIGEPGTTAVLELVDDGSANGDEGCNALTGFTSGNIALIRRGSCEFGTKGLRAQQAGASAMIVINNDGGNGTINMGAGNEGGQVTIPVAMIGNQNGNIIVADLANQITGTLIREGGTLLNRDSDLDAGVIAHEYGHGLSIRLTGGPSTSSCLFGAEQAGEGWSDFLGLWLTAKAEDQIDQPRGIGSYLIWQENIPGATIRPAPYIRDMSINPLTYDRVRTAGQAGGVSIPHGVGTVYNTIIWDLYWNLVEKYGFDEDFYTGTGGNNITMQLVVDALKLQPCGPTFVTNRDATLLADQIAYDGANQCEIWEAFARRGVGVNASDGGSSSNQSGIIEDFTVPEACEGLNEATLAFGQLTQTYDGQPKPVAVTTDPEGLSVVVTYDGDETPPIDAGSYAVIATVDDDEFSGSASATLVIEPAAASIEVDGLEQTYTGDAIVVQITTSPPGLNLAVSYNGSTDLPVNAGEYLVEISIDENNYAGDFSDTLTVLPAAAAITFDELEQLFTGQALVPAITTDPDGLQLLVSYDGEPTLPVAVGDYLVAASIDENNYAGSASTTFTILSSGPKGLRVIAGPAGNNVINRPLTPPLVVEVLDAAGDILTSDNETSIAISVTGQGGEIITGDRIQTAQNGVVAFTNLIITQPGSGYLLIIEDEEDELDAILSDPFDVLGESVFEDRFEQ